MPLNRVICVLFSSLILLTSSCLETRKMETGPEVIEHFLGSTLVKLRVASLHRSNYVFINLHDNEVTAEQTVLKFINEKGGNFLKIENGRKRTLSFRMGNENFEFDPNRMFSYEGRKSSLQKLGNYKEEASREIEYFAASVLDKVLAFKYIIALHNNTDGNYSIASYLDQYRTDAASVYINDNMDPDDFIFTTDQFIFEKLKNARVNVILQNNLFARDDGSLSVYAGKNNLRYINIETEHGHNLEQERLLNLVVKLLQ